MKNLKVVFFGTPEFAKVSLEAIHHSAHQVVGVVTVSDKQAGRGQKISESPVKKYAVEQNLPIFQPEKLRNSEFLAQMQMLDADVFVVVAFRMMPKVLFSMPKLGTFNLHASLLPDYRGAAPINFAIINGENTTGATTFFINEKIDEGHILLQESLSIGPDETAGELHDRLMTMGAQLTVKTLDALAEGRIQEVPQTPAAVQKNAFKIFKDDTKIRWNQASASIHNFIRGLSPYPCAYTQLKIGQDEKSLKIYRGQPVAEPHSELPGTVKISKTEFKIATADGYYLPSEVQLEGKKRLPVKDFLNGFRDFSEIKLV